LLTPDSQFGQANSPHGNALHLVWLSNLVHSPDALK